MKGLEDLFAKAFDKEATKRGFKADEKPLFGGSLLYKTSEWLIGHAMVTLFPETVVTITFTPQNPPPEAGKQHLMKCLATWLPGPKKWEMIGRTFTSTELISYAFDQLEKQASTGTLSE